MSRYASFVPLVFLLLASCSGLKYVPKGELLYTGAKVKVLQTQKITGQGEVKSAAAKVIRPKPNSSIFGMRLRLVLYYKMGTPRKPKGIKSWIKTKLGEPPVYLSAVDANLISRGIDAGLYNTGFLDSYSQSQIVANKDGKTASLLLKLNLREPYTIATVTFPAVTDTLSKLINKTAKKTLLKKGDRYSLETLVKERERIDAYLKKKGYYYFRPDYVLFKMDTGNNNRTLNLQAILKTNTPAKAKTIYHIGEVNVFPDYRLGDSLGTEKLVIDSINYYKGSAFIRPKPVLSAVFYRPGQTYSSRIHQVTLSRLNGLGVFKFINVELRDKDTTSDQLDVNVYLTAMQRKSLSVEVDGATKSNDFIGPSVNLSLRNRNAFRGAELIIYNVQGSFETQYSGQYKGLFTYQLNPKIELDVPRILSAFHVKSAQMYTPRTQFSIEYAYLSRVGYFDMNTIKLEYGYKWKPSLEVDHSIKPVSIDFYNIYHTTDLFNQLIDENALIKSRFMEQFVPGISYSFFYNQQVHPERKDQFYFNGNVQLAGNMVSLASWAVQGRYPTADDPTKILGVSFAQFARFDIDVRNFYHITQLNVIAARFIAGWGKAYGNATTLPYANQFFSGGAYSLRGFAGNAVGPGSYTPPDSIHDVFYQQQGGEIKLEFNLEYRFPIYSVLRGAVFFDAGNTWLNKASPDAPGGEFKWNTFASQIAMSTGAGLRVDLSFFVLRLDLGLPLRNPAFPEDERWVIKNTHFSSVLFNLAFGYPF